MVDNRAREQVFGRKVGMLEKVYHVRLENLGSLWDNLEETPPAKLIRDALLRGEEGTGCSTLK